MTRRLTKGATLVFFSREGAERFMGRYHEMPLRVGGNELYIKYSMNKTGPCRESQATRMLVIRGVKDKVNQEWLTDFLKTTTDIRWDTDAVELTRLGARNKLEWTFASWKCQAEFIFQELKHRLPESMWVTYGSDPCGTI